MIADRTTGIWIIRADGSRHLAHIDHAELPIVHMKLSPAPLIAAGDVLSWEIGGIEVEAVAIANDPSGTTVWVTEQLGKHALTPDWLPAPAPVSLVKRGEVFQALSREAQSDGIMIEANSRLCVGEELTVNFHVGMQPITLHGLVSACKQSVGSTLITAWVTIVDAPVACRLRWQHYIDSLAAQAA